MIVVFLALYILQIVFSFAQVESASNDNSVVNVDEKSKILSRRKRFLVFPEGSSFQLVFCNTFPLLNPIEDIMLLGYTAAVAYELPQDPYSPFDHHGDPLHRRQDTKEIFYLDEDGKVTHKRKYQKKFIVNPAMAKRSINDNTMDKLKKKVDRKQMHEKHKRELSNLDARNIEFHRMSRKILYRKLEIMLQGLGANGRECLLKTLCLVGQTQHQPQGSFFQEILRAVFTLPKSHTEDYDQDAKEYDAAYYSDKSCEEKFPDCAEKIQGPELATTI